MPTLPRPRPLQQSRPIQPPEDFRLHKVYYAMADLIQALEKALHAHPEVTRQVVAAFTRDLVRIDAEGVWEGLE